MISIDKVNDVIRNHRELREKNSLGVREYTNLFLFSFEVNLIGY